MGGSAMESKSGKMRRLPIRFSEENFFVSDMFFPFLIRCFRRQKRPKKRSGCPSPTAGKASSHLLRQRAAERMFLSHRTICSRRFKTRRFFIIPDGRENFHPFPAFCQKHFTGCSADGPLPCRLPGCMDFHLIILRTGFIM